MEDLKLTVKDLKLVSVTKLKEFVNNLDDDAELYVGIGDTMSRCVDILLDLTGSTVTFIDQTYFEESCRIIGEKNEG